MRIRDRFRAALMDLGVHGTGKARHRRCFMGAVTALATALVMTARVLFRFRLRLGLFALLRGTALMAHSSFPFRQDKR
jgi:hypothetical protein